MKVIKNINNNVAVCLDSSGKELIAIGKGIGFKKPPYEIDIKDIERTYYNLDDRYIDLLETIDEDIIQIAIDIRKYSERMNIVTSPNLVFTLADHIKFAIERVQKGISFQLPIENDIQKMFPDETEVGRYALKLIEERLGQ
jgi:beta-glucoside operon transcriptional antiterminator